MIARNVLVFALLGVAFPAAATDWICVPDMSTGFKWKSTRWESVNFNTDHTYIVSEVPSYDWLGAQIGAEVNRPGSPYAEYRCEGSIPDNGVLVCGAPAMNFIFNSGTLRYQEYYGIGFLDGSDTEGNTPFIEIGKCSALR